MEIHLTPELTVTGKCAHCGSLDVGFMDIEQVDGMYVAYLDCRACGDLSAVIVGPKARKIVCVEPSVTTTKKETTNE